MADGSTPPSEPSDKTEPFEIDLSSRATNDRAETPRDRSMAPKTIAIAATVVGALLLITALLFSSDRKTDIASRPDPTPTPIELAPLPSPQEFATPEPTLTALEARRAAVSLDQALAIAQSELSLTDPANRLAFLTDDGVQVLRFDEATVWRPFQRQGTSSVIDGALLRSATGTTYGLLPNDPDTVEIVASQRFFWRSDDLGVYAVALNTELGDERPASGLPIMPNAVVVTNVVTQRTQIFDLEPSASVRGIDGLGVVIFDPASGSQVATLDGLENLSEHEVIDAANGAVLERRCSPTCQLELTGPDGPGLPLPTGFEIDGAVYLLSPSGESVMRISNGGAHVWNSTTGVERTVAEGGVVVPQWTPDGEWVVWLADRVDEDLLYMVNPTGGRRVVIDLALVGASPLRGPEIAIYTAPTDGP